jgi:hypothetical protein
MRGRIDSLARRVAARDTCEACGRAFADDAAHLSDDDLNGRIVRKLRRLAEAPAGRALLAGILAETEDP